MNWRAGFKRLFTVVAVAWIGFVLWIASLDSSIDPDHVWRLGFLPVIISYLLLFRVWPWIWRGFSGDPPESRANPNAIRDFDPEAALKAARSSTGKDCDPRPDYGGPVRSNPNAIRESQPANNEPEPPKSPIGGPQFANLQEPPDVEELIERLPDDNDLSNRLRRAARLLDRHSNS